MKPAGGSTRREKAASVPSQNTKGKTNDERPTGVVPQTLSRGRSTHRRRPGSHRADVRGQDSSVRQLPHFSPQYDIRTLRSLGRNPETASYRNVNQSKQDALKVIPLGGLCEIGKNMTVYEYGSDMIIVDVGVAFPEEHQPGIDSVIPDMSYVFENRAKLRGVFLTHGHEDHIGAISWLLRDIDVPVYGRPLTIGLVDYKLEDKGVRGRSRLLHPVEYGEIVKAGVFGVEFINVNHSIADAASLALHTPAGVVIHSGDFKIDYTPVFGEPIDLGRFAELGNQGVLLFNCESTNIERRGSTPSEQKVGEAFSKHFAKAPGRIIVATFSSNVSRVQQVISAAEKHGRHVALMGRSMLNVFRAARRLGYLQIQPNTLIEADDIDRHAPEKVVIITTGSQGEPTSGLTRMAYSEHRSIEIQPGDMVIISATPIPGNEKSLYRVIDELYKRRATVVYSDLADIHVSGHAYRDEIELMHRLIRPRYFIPGHGEYRHLHIHAEVAHALGQSWDTIYLLNNGDILECTPESARIAGYTSASAVLIDGSPTGTVNQEILEQRQSLSDDGVVAVAIAVDSKRRRLVGEPQIMTRGFIYEEDSRSVERDCIREIRNYAEKALNSGQPLMTMLDAPRLRERIRDQLFQKTGRRPVVLIQILDVTA
ncbi:MAG: ribonuclease J [Bacillota bacterium]|nr:ribonuclease J [Bacillota bacterium]